MTRLLVVVVSTALLWLPAGSSPSAEAATLPAPVACPGCWHPDPITSWQWQLSGKLDTSFAVQMYDVDAFETSASQVSTLHQAGRTAICYIDAGTWENFRPDAGRFPKRVLGDHNGWSGERWLDIRKLAVLTPIMQARMDMCANKGFDGVEFDNVDGYQNHSGFPLTGADQLRYDVWLANQAHRRGLSVGLKNDLGQVKTLLPYFDWALNEQCFQYKECSKLQPFLDAGKAVFNVEYKLDAARFCPKANAMNFNSLKKKLNLEAWRVACR